MYCWKCGNPMPDNTRFCPRCGSEQKLGGGSVDVEEKWMKLAETGAAAIPYVLVLPITLQILTYMIGWIPGAIFGGFNPFTIIYHLLYILHQLIDLAVVLGGAAILACLIIRIAKVGFTSARLIGAIVSVLSLVSGAMNLTWWRWNTAAGGFGIRFEYYWGKYGYYNSRAYLHVIAWILFVVAAVLAFDLAVKVFLKKEGLRGEVDLKDDIEVLKAFSAIRREESGARKTEARRNTTAGAYAGPTGVPAKVNVTGTSYYDGNGIELFALNLLLGLVTCVTCGIAMPWMYCKKAAYVTKHTVIDGHRLDFNGTGGELFGNWIKWWLLTCVTCGVYGLWVHRALLMWECSHITFEDHAQPAGEAYVNSWFDGSLAESVGVQYLGRLLPSVTCGMAAPWTITMDWEFYRNHMVVNGFYLKYRGKGGDLFPVWIVQMLLTAITCGIYGSWMQTKLLQYQIERTHMDLARIAIRNPNY